MSAGTPDAGWRDRWDGGRRGSVVLDLGEQAAGDHFPLPQDPLPDQRYPLRMVVGAESRLAQLETDPTTADEPRGVEPASMTEQALDAVARASAAGFVRPGATVKEYDSPHGGTWLPHLEEAGMRAGDGVVDLVVDVFSMMHEADQRAGLARRAAHLGPGSVLLLQFHSLAAILRNGTWNALRHGHYAYYSTPTLLDMADQVGLRPLAAWEFELYGGTVLLALGRRADSLDRVDEPPDDVREVVARELSAGVHDPTRIARLGNDLQRSVATTRRWLDDARAVGLRVTAYGAASRASALLTMAGISRSDVQAIGDASGAKQGRCMPISRIPIVAPAEMVALRPDRVLLFVPDMLREMRATLPEIEANGGRWVVLDPEPRVVEPF